MIKLWPNSCLYLDIVYVFRYQKKHIKQLTSVFFLNGHVVLTIVMIFLSVLFNFTKV